MKRILYLLLMPVLVLFVATACDDDEYTPEDLALEVVSADVQFEADVATGTVVVRAQGSVEVDCDADWCSFTKSGSVINVSVTRNETLMGRNTVMTIRDGRKSARINVSQQGLRLSVDKNIVYFPRIGGNGQVKYKTNYPVKFTELVGGDGWLDLTITSGSINFTAATVATGLYGMRTASMSIYCEMGDGRLLKEELEIVQSNLLPYESMLGEWKMDFEDGAGTPQSSTVTFAEKEPGHSFSVTLASGASYRPPVFDYDPVRGDLSVSSGQILQTVDLLGIPLHVALCVGHPNNDGSNTWFLTLDSKARMGARLSGFVPQNEVTYSFGDVGSVEGHEFDTMWIGMILNGAALAGGDSRMMRNVVLTKL